MNLTLNVQSNYNNERRLFMKATAICSLYFMISPQDLNAVNIKKVLKWLLYYVLEQLEAPTDTKPEEELTTEESNMVNFRLGHCINCHACEPEWSGVFDDEEFNEADLQSVCPIGLFDEEFYA